MSDINLRNVPDELYKRVKVEAAKAGMTLKDFAIAALARACGLPVVESSENKVLRAIRALIDADLSGVERAVVSPELVVSEPDRPVGPGASSFQREKRAKHSPRCACTICRPVRQ